MLMYVTAPGYVARLPLSSYFVAPTVDLAGFVFCLLTISYWVEARCTLL
jgi:hypothetical protein